MHSEDDADCLHVRRADAVVALRGSGPAAYRCAAQARGASGSTELYVEQLRWPASPSRDWCPRPVSTPAAIAETVVP